jgi:RNA-directed DNA polymerase
MLATLEKGVTGGKWYSLIDKLYPIATLAAAFAAVKANQGAAGVDHVSIEDYAANLETNLARLSETLRTGTYRPQAIRRHYIPKPGSQEKRPLGIPTVQDRVVQTALRMLLEPIFERDFAAQSYGFRPNLGCKDALRRVDELLKAGYVHVVDADLKSSSTRSRRTACWPWWPARCRIAVYLRCSGRSSSSRCWKAASNGRPSKARRKAR